MNNYPDEATDLRTWRQLLESWRRLSYENLDEIRQSMRGQQSPYDGVTLYQHLAVALPGVDGETIGLIAEDIVHRCQAPFFSRENFAATKRTIEADFLLPLAYPLAGKKLRQLKPTL